MNHTSCPYCGKTISYPSALVIRRNGEYFCKKCKKESNVHIRKTIFLVFALTLIISLAALLFFLFMTDRENLWFMLIVALPYLFFYMCTPFFVRLVPKKKFQDALYDTEMVDTPLADPDPTVASTAKVVPAFVDDIVLGDNDYKPAIDSSVFNAIKEERKVVAETDGGTRSFDKFENISSGSNTDHTKTINRIRDVSKYQ